MSQTYKRLRLGNNSGDLVSRLTDPLLGSICVIILTFAYDALLVVTFLFLKVTHTTALQIGHFMLIIPLVAGSASNNRLFLQHGQDTWTNSFP